MTLLPTGLQQERPKPSLTAYHKACEEGAKQLVLAAFEGNARNYSATARELNIGRRRLMVLLQRYGVYKPKVHGPYKKN